MEKFISDSFISESPEVYVHSTVSNNSLANMRGKEYFPDGSKIDNWFYDFSIKENKQKYILTDYDIRDDGKVYTKEIQDLIDYVSVKGGGDIVVPAGTFISGALFFKPSVNLYIEKNGILKGSDNIADYPVRDTRIEGESCVYFPALINADGIDGFRIYGEGTIDGNGKKSWKAFWMRREWNPDCTNKDEQRPRLCFLSNCKNSVISGVNLINSHFWTLHIYKCQKTKIFNCKFHSPKEPIPAPSTDAIDIDACTDVLIRNCTFEVNDDGIALKGGKGPDADVLSENGANERVIIEDCLYNFCHGCLTCGSESIHNKNIIVRRIKVKNAVNLLWLKMRPDTPQHYEYILFDNIEGNVDNFVNINPWTQFYNLKGNKNVPISISNNITMQNCNIVCDSFLNITPDNAQYRLSFFLFENLHIKAKKPEFKRNIIENLILNNVNVDTYLD